MQSRNFRLQKVGDINWIEKHYQLQKVSFFIDELIILNASRGVKSIDDFSEMIHRNDSSLFYRIKYSFVA